MRGRSAFDDSAARPRRLISATGPFNNIVVRRATVGILFTRRALAVLRDDKVHRTENGYAVVDSSANRRHYRFFQ